MATTTLHRMIELNKDGHTEISWDPDDAAQVASAKIAFDAAKAKGYQMFRSDEGEVGQRISTFDPSAEKIVMVKQIVAG